MYDIRRNDGKEMQGYKLDYSVINKLGDKYEIRVEEVWEPVLGAMYLKCRVELRQAVYAEYKYKQQ